MAGNIFGVINPIPGSCSQCEELTILKKEIEDIKMEILRLLEKEIAPDRKRIRSIEMQLPKIKESIQQLSTAKSLTGSWGIANQRGDLIYSRLISMKNDKGKTVFLSTGDIKKILGVSTYSQVYAAMDNCIKRHLDILSIDRGKRRAGLTLKEVEI